MKTSISHSNQTALSETEKISTLLWRYALPAVIGTQVNALYNIVDCIYIGQGVAPLAISRLTLTFPILMVLQAFGMLIRNLIFLSKKLVFSVFFP